MKRIEQGGHKVIIKLHQTWISRDHNNYVLVITFLWQNFRYNRWQAINNDNFFDKTCRGYGCHLCTRYVPVHDGSTLQLAPAGHLSQWAQVCWTTWPNYRVLRNSVSFFFFAQHLNIHIVKYLTGLSIGISCIQAAG